MIQKIVSLTLKESKTELIPDDGKDLLLEEMDFHIDHPYITYKTIRRVSKGEKKPRFRESIKGVGNDEGKVGQIYGQKFESLIQFNIIASTYKEAETIMQDFEESMFNYTGFFKKNGISEIIFDSQLTDDSYDSYRKTLSIRNIRYYVEVEKLYVLFKEKIKAVEIHSLN